MKTEWAEYLESIGIKELFLKRVEEISAFYQELYPDQVEDIFVTDYIDGDGNRQYQNLWLLSQTLVLEAKNFLNSDDFDFTLLKNGVKYWTIKKTEYDFREASTKSRMQLIFSLNTGVAGDLNASGNNCDYLKKVFSKYIIPNQVKCNGFGEEIETDAANAHP